jgi:hypothetical protein
VDLHFGGRTALSQGFEAGRDLTREGSVEFLLGCVVYSHSNQVRSPEIVANLRPEATLLTLPILSDIAPQRAGVSEESPPSPES